MVNNSFKEIYRLGGEFFEKIIRLYDDNHYDYFVLTTRRCFCLFFALLKDVNFYNLLIQSHSEETIKKIVKKTVSSQGINILGEELKDKKILLLDDVMIHGHAVYNLYKNVNNYEPKCLDTLVIIRNIETPDFYYKATNKEYFYIERLMSSEWRDISNQVVKYLHNQGQCYTSYIYGIKTETNFFENIVSGNKYLNEISLDFEELETYPEYNTDCYPQYYSVEEYSSCVFIENIMIRKYCIEDDKKNCMVVPYVQLKALHSETLVDIWETICTVIGEQFNKIKTLEDKYKALNAICSICLYKKYFNSISSYENEIDRSFIPYFLEIVYNNFDLDYIFGIINEKYVATEFDSGNTLMEKSFVKAQKEFFTNETESKAKMVDFLSIYFYLVTEEEEFLYQNEIEDEENTKPIFSTQFNKMLKETDFSEPSEEFTNAVIMYFVDIGLLSYVVKCNENGLIGSCIKTGEQSYHLFTKIAKDAYKAVYVILNYTLKLDAFSEKNMFEKRFKKELNNSSIEESIKKSINFFMNNPPVKLHESYFGVLKERLKIRSITRKENSNLILKSIINIMDSSCDGALVL